MARNSKAEAKTTRGGKKADEKPARMTRAEKRAAEEAAAKKTTRGGKKAEAPAPAKKARGSRRGADLPASNVNPDDLMYDVAVVGKTVIEVSGVLQSITQTEIVLRHKKPKTSKMMFTTFPMKDVIAVVGGEEGAPCVVTVRKLTTVAQYVGTIVHMDGGLVQVTTASGEIVTLNPDNSSDLEVQMTALEENTAASAGGGRKKRGAKVEEADDEEDGDDEEDDEDSEEDDEDSEEDDEDSEEDDEDDEDSEDDEEDDEDSEEDDEDDEDSEEDDEDSEDDEEDEDGDDEEDEDDEEDFDNEDDEEDEK